MQKQITKTTERIAELEARIEKQQSRIFDCGLTPRNLRRLNRLEQRLEVQQNKLDELTALQEKEAAAAVDPILFDSFAISVTPVADVLTRIEIEVTDSPFDDTFTGGDLLKLQTVASGRYTGRGFSTYTSTGTLASGDYWVGPFQQTLTSGSSTWNNFVDYPDLVVNVLDADNQILGTQSFDPAVIFA